jgi:hypothetical protein
MPLNSFLKCLRFLATVIKVVTIATESVQILEQPICISAMADFLRLAHLFQTLFNQRGDYVSVAAIFQQERPGHSIIHLHV